MTILINKIYNYVDTYFEDHIKYIINDTLYIKYDKINCLILNVNDDKLIISGLKKEKLSGTILLKRISELIYQNVHEINLIYLGDQSIITLSLNTIFKEKYILSLAHLHILVKNKSWYNSCGFFQKNYLEQYEQWNRIRNMSLIDCLDSITKDNYIENDNFIAAHRNFTYFVKFEETGHLKREYYLKIGAIFDLNLKISTVCSVIMMILKRILLLMLQYLIYIY